MHVLGKDVHNYLTCTVDLDNQRNVEMVLEYDGKKDKKVVRYDDFLSIVNDKEVYTITASIPKLPENTLQINWAEESTYDIAVFVPKAKRFVCFLDQEMSVCYPHLLFKFRIKAGRMQESLAFAVKDDFDRLNKSSELFNYPYGNVSYGGGNICWGSNAIPEIREPYDLNKMLWMFFSSNTNNHLWSRGCNAKAESIDELYLAMSRADVFDDNLLVSNGIVGKILK